MPVYTIKILANFEDKDHFGYYQDIKVYDSNGRWLSTYGGWTDDFHKMEPKEISSNPIPYLFVAEYKVWGKSEFNSFQKFKEWQKKGLPESWLMEC